MGDAGAGVEGVGAGVVPIVLVARDRQSMFAAALASLLENTDHAFRIVIVSDAADPQTIAELAAAAERPEVTVLHVSHPLTAAEGRLLGLSRVSERYCVILENDTLVHPGWLSPLLQCMRDEGVAAVAPVVFWYRGLHAAGCSLTLHEDGGRRVLRHSILYGDVRRKTIGYPESHCVLLDMKQFEDVTPFDEAEPFDVDFGMTLREHGLTALLEPAATVTYSAPPPWELRDLPLALRHWDGLAWEQRHERFLQKWNVGYDSRAKRASYRRQHIKLAPVRHHPGPLSLRVTNTAARLSNSASKVLTRRRTERSFG